MTYHFIRSILDKVDFILENTGNPDHVDKVTEYQLGIPYLLNAIREDLLTKFEPSDETEESDYERYLKGILDPRD